MNKVKLISLSGIIIMVVMNGYQSLPIKRDTKKKLDDISRKETYDHLINRLIDFYKKEKVWKIGE